jgi:hypothetical protein
MKLKKPEQVAKIPGQGEVRHQLEQAGKDGHVDAALALAAERERAPAEVVAAIDQEEN